jgi:hypothetical protein
MTTLAQAVARRDAFIARGPVAPIVFVRPPGDVDWQPTPTRAEVIPDAVVLGQIKLWDRSPVDQNSFDPTQPPLAALPVNTAPPNIVLFDTLEVGHVLAGQTGSWSGSPTYARQWLRDSADIPGATATSYTLAAADVGRMIGLRVIATNEGGSVTALAEPVGPVIAAPLRRKRA